MCAGSAGGAAGGTGLLPLLPGVGAVAQCGPNPPGRPPAAASAAVRRAVWRSGGAGAGGGGHGPAAGWPHPLHRTGTRAGALWEGAFRTTACHYDWVAAAGLRAVGGGPRPWPSQVPGHTGSLPSWPALAGAAEGGGGQQRACAASGAAGRAALRQPRQPGAHPAPLCGGARGQGVRRSPGQPAGRHEGEVSLEASCLGPAQRAGPCPVAGPPHLRPPASSRPVRVGARHAVRTPWGGAAAGPAARSASMAWLCGALAARTFARGCARPWWTSAGSRRGSPRRSVLGVAGGRVACPVCTCDCVTELVVPTHYMPNAASAGVRHR
jgi:hypothetical protein